MERAITNESNLNFSITARTVIDSGGVSGVESSLPDGISIGNIYTLGEIPDLRGIIDSIHEESGTLLQPELEDLEKSFEAGKAVVLMDREEAVGYVRLSSLLDHDGKERLRLSEAFPEIAETGTAIIKKDHRHRGFYPKMRTELINMVAQDIKDDKLLVLGTTKNLRVIESIDDSTEETGIEFEIVNRHDIPMIAPFTCVCEGDFGNGYQYGTECHQAPTDRQLVQIESHDMWRGRVVEDSNGKIPCTIYVSSLELVGRMEEALADQFGSQQELVNALLEDGHYE